MQNVMLKMNVYVSGCFALTCWCSLEMLNLTISCNFLQCRHWSKAVTYIKKTYIKKTVKYHRFFEQKSDAVWPTVYACFLKTHPRICCCFSLPQIYKEMPLSLNPYMLLLWFKTIPVTVKAFLWEPCFSQKEKTTMFSALWWCIFQIIKWVFRWFI